MPDPWSLRLAAAGDIPALEKLIALSVRTLLAPHYSPEVLEASLGSAFGVDSQLIGDGTYFAVEADGEIVGCGGWSRRPATYGADRLHARSDKVLNPAVDPARIRAFFVHPQWARRGIGRAILEASETAARTAGFSRAIMVATLAGEKLYEVNGYVAEERYDAPLPGGLKLPVVRMGKELRGEV
jgi:GNAT superfamily N-acetyltransferase